LGQLLLELSRLQRALIPITIRLRRDLGDGRELTFRFNLSNVYLLVRNKLSESSIEIFNLLQLAGLSRWILIEINNQILLFVKVIIFSRALFVLTHAFFIHLIFIVLANLSVKIWMYFSVIVQLLIFLLLLLVSSLGLFDDFLVFNYLSFESVFIAFFALLEFSDVLFF
jgi:hypothetical protein